MSVLERARSIVGQEHARFAPELGGLPIAAPADVGEARGLLELARADDLRLVPVGFGSRLSWVPRPERVDLLLETRRLTGLVEFVPADGTLTARAGTPMLELARAARAEGLELTPDVPRPERSTLGGTLAAGASGPDRTRHGPARLHVLGTRCLLASGEEAKSGGRLVKNVTGYDLHRLYCGSFGSVALLLEASLRLSPLPEVRRVAGFAATDLNEALELAARVRALNVGLRTLTVTKMRGAAWWLSLELAGRAAQVRADGLRLDALRVADEVLEAEAAMNRVRELRDAEPDSAVGATLHLTARPSRLTDACAALFRALGDVECGDAVLQPAVATLDLGLPELDPRELARRVSATRTDLAPLGARLELRGRGVELLESTATPPEVELAERLARAHDPNHVFALKPRAGRLVP